MKIKDVMTSSVVTVKSDDTAEKAAQLMKQYNIGCVPVVNENMTLGGVITDRDIVIRSIAEGKNPAEETVRNIMSENVVTASPDMDICEITAEMADCRVRRIPVVENGKVVGMASLGDIASTGDYKTEVSCALCDISEGCGCNK